jgi:ATP/maltotriose-dependent transcriptional regulator MalT
MASSPDLAERERCEQELLELAGRLDDPALRVNAALWRYDTDVLTGRGERLEELLRSAAAHARALRNSSFHHSIAYERASLALLRGRVAEADSLVERAAAFARERHLTAVPSEAIRLAQLLLVRHDQGRLAELRDELAAAFAPSGIPAWVGVIAYVDVLTGRPDGAAERLDAMLDEYARRGPTAICSPGLLALMAGAVVRLGDADRARRLHGLVAPVSGQGGYVAGFAGPIDLHLGTLERFLGDHAQARGRFAAAAAFCARLGAPVWEARCRAALDAS